MKGYTEAMRALAYWTSALLDLARLHPDEAVRKHNQALVDLMIPVVKGWSTETGIECASLGVQVHGGMGFIEETGAAQHLRDARITTIYEGTTGIQANDLVGRKVGREGGATVRALMAEMGKVPVSLAGSSDVNLREIGAALARALANLREATDWIVTVFPAQPAAVAAGSVYYLKLMGVTCGMWMMARSAEIATRQLAAGEGDPAYLRAKLQTARFFGEHIAAQSTSLANTVVHGADSVLSADEALL
jgi:hypothetical protein